MATAALVALTVALLAMLGAMGGACFVLGVKSAL